MKQDNILIVDDEQGYANMLAKRLSLRGFDCQVCYTGQSAIELNIWQNFAMVLLDLQLPDLYGTEVLKQIKHSRPEAAVIIITGHGSRRDEEACMQNGAYEFIHKPVDINRLMEIMAQIKEKTECQLR